MIKPITVTTCLAITLLTGCDTAQPGDPVRLVLPESSPSVRPSEATATALTPTPAAPPTSPARTSRPPAQNSGRRYVFPVAGNASYARTHAGYPASDIMAPCGAVARAAVDGVVHEVSLVDSYDPDVNDGATRGGMFVAVLGDDGVRYYGSHLRAVLAGIRPGVRVTAGQQLGEVGRTGLASACHLHFAISPPCARTGDWWVRRGVVWPWPYLDSWRAAGSRSPVAEVTSWQPAKGCPTKPPPGA